MKGDWSNWLLDDHKSRIERKTGVPELKTCTQV